MSSQSSQLTHNEIRCEILLYIYDMSKGLAKSVSQIFLGKELPGIWHTSIVAYDREYFFGSFGIESCNAGETMLGEPDQILSLGVTELPYSLFLEFIFSLGESSFAPRTYQLFEHNCNNFSNEVSLFLTGKPIPQEIVDLPSEVLSTPIGQTLKLYLTSLSIRPEGSGVSISTTAEDTQRASPSHLQSHHTSQHNSKLKTEDSIENNSEDLSESDNISDTIASIRIENTEHEVPEASAQKSNDNAVADEQTTKPTLTRRTYKYDDSPVLFKRVDGNGAIKKLVELVSGLLSSQQQQMLKDLKEYLTTESGAWTLDSAHLDLIALLLNGGDGKFAPNVPLLMLEALQAAALKDDIVLILHQDRKDHRLMSYFNKIESLTLAEQEEIAKLFCNLCSQANTFDWLLYISEWSENDGQSSSNSKVTTRAAVHTILNDKLTTLQKTGVSLIFNLALKELFEDTATELATAVIQFLHGDLEEEQAFMCITAIIRFMAISYNDVPVLVKMLGPDITKFKGKSERLDQTIKEFNAILNTSLQ